MVSYSYGRDECIAFHDTTARVYRIDVEPRHVAESHGFQNFILGVILATAVIVGVETSEPLMARYGGVFEVADMVVQTIFVLEILIRLLAH